MLVFGTGPIVSTLPASARPFLEKELDWDHNGVNLDLNEIALHMIYWEENVSALLELTEVDLHDIREMHPYKPVQQR